MSDHASIGRESAFRKTECETDASTGTIGFIVRQGEGRALWNADAAHHAVERMVFDARRQGLAVGGIGRRVHGCIKPCGPIRGKLERLLGKGG